MSNTNDITGDKIQSKLGNQEAYESGWDQVFKIPKTTPCSGHSQCNDILETTKSDTKGCCGECS